MFRSTKTLLKNKKLRLCFAEDTEEDKRNRETESVRIGEYHLFPGSTLSRSILSSVSSASSVVQFFRQLAEVFRLDFVLAVDFFDEIFV